MGREEDAAAAGWLRYGEVHCGQGTRTGVKSGTSSSGHSLEPGGMGWKGAEASWVVARLEHTELPTADVLVSSLSAGGSQSGKLKVGHAPPHTLHEPSEVRLVPSHHLQRPCIVPSSGQGRCSAKLAYRGWSGRALPLQTAICPVPGSNSVYLLKKNTALSQSHRVPPFPHLPQGL